TPSTASASAKSKIRAANFRIANPKKARRSTRSRKSKTPLLLRSALPAAISSRFACNKLCSSLLPLSALPSSCAIGMAAASRKSRRSRSPAPPPQKTPSFAQCKNCVSRSNRLPKADKRQKRWGSSNPMEHLMEEQLIAFHDGDRTDRERISGHLASCPECRAALEKIEAVFAAMDAMPVPDPGENYGQRVWAAISPRLPERHPGWWESFFAPRRLVAVGAFAAILVLAFLAGRYWRRPPSVPGGTETVDTAKVRERILVVAV